MQRDEAKEGRDHGLCCPHAGPSGFGEERWAADQEVCQTRKK